MSTVGIRSADRVESFVAAADAYEPAILTNHEDAFRVFARFISRSVDARYLDRHPPHELLPDLERLMAASMVRAPDEVKVRLNIEEGSKGRRGVLISCMQDQLFIYSVIRLALEQLGIKYYRSLNSIVPVRRSATGEIVAIGVTDAPRESFIWMEVEAQDLEQRRAAIEAQITRRLQVVQQVVEDFQPMREVVIRLAQRSELMAQERPDHRQVHEANAAFLRWALNEHFVFLGMRFLPLEKSQPADAVANLGVGRFEDDRGIHIGDAERAVLEMAGISPFLWIRKSATESWVYRPGQCDHVLVQCFDSRGGPAGLLVIEGLFSYQALAQPRTNTPLLDRMIDQLYAQLQATKGTHRYRTIRNAFNSLPLEYLFTLQLEDVRQLVEQVIDVDLEQRLQTHITVDDTQSTAFVFVALPRSHYSDELRADIRKMLQERFRATSIDDGVYAGNVDSVTLHFFLTGVARLDKGAQDILLADIEQAASPWTERLFDVLREQYEVAKARDVYGLYHGAFSARYRETTSVSRAAADIEILEGLEKDAQFECDIYRETDDRHLNVTRLRMFQSSSMLLSDILPILDNLGLVVIDQYPTTVQVPGRAEHTIATFRIGGVQGLKLDLLSRRNRLRDGIRAVVEGAMSNDPLNRLLLHADIPWTYVVLMSAYQHYARQLGLPYALSMVQDALLAHADIVRGLTEFFRAKFDPDLEGTSSTEVDDKRLALIDRSQRYVLSLLEAVEDLTSDEILRTFYNLIDATVRTNFYARAPMKQHHVVLKLDPSKIRRMPDPRPYREIYVHHPLVQGLHLRGGPVARGGLRWSDRKLDFRTEVLGLMATQNLKNVLIVPRGAKGAFVLTSPSLDMAERRKQSDVVYKIFVGGLLDVTDNLVDGPDGHPKQVHPERVICHDPMDHYLVVAADKGTAHQSDNANGLAETRGFWLGDAFASGGSSGYDHKKEAITARGAWECVKRHFREINLHPETAKITVVGIGDMSGDVFGNGMLLSKSMQLVGAFDHRHIFVDPNPDPALSFEARLELFKTPRSSWNDYPRKALSPGGGIYPRGAKAIALSAEARKVLGIEHDEPLSGPELIKAILRAPVDLLWNGGIGTYIKASQQTHLDIGDTTNDDVRVDATEVRAKVIGEGGNLGISQEGRVELATRGIRLNTDAVDNSAGVDLSDHEVNLKILFKGMISRGVMTQADRDNVMEQIREQVDLSTLHNNWVQSRMLSLDVVRSKRDIMRFYRAMLFLQDRVPFKRREMYLPGERIVRQRAPKNEGLYRPELAMLCANAKLDMKQELARTHIFPASALADELLSYFPSSVAERFRDEILAHPLADDIARTMLVNRLIGDVGASWLAETTLMTGRSTEEILNAYFKATELVGATEVKRELDRIQDHLTTDREYELRLITEDALEEVSNWILHHSGPLRTDFYKAFALALQAPYSAGNEAGLAAFQKAVETLTAEQVPHALAVKLEALRHINEVLDVAVLATESGETVTRAAGALYAIGSNSGLIELIRDALSRTGEEDLDRPARMALRGLLRRQLIALAAELLRHEKDVQHVSATSKVWVDGLRNDLLPLVGGDKPLCNLVVQRTAPSVVCKA